LERKVRGKPLAFETVGLFGTTLQGAELSEDGFVVCFLVGFWEFRLFFAFLGAGFSRNLSIGEPFIDFQDELSRMLRMF
jgi:hypothetical protein